MDPVTERCLGTCEEKVDYGRAVRVPVEVAALRSRDDFITVSQGELTETVTVTGVDATDNTALYSDGGLSVSSWDTSGSVSISDSRITGNQAGGRGGGLEVRSGTATLTGSAPNVKKVNLQMAYPTACAFTVKVLKNGTVVAKATKSFAGSNTVHVVAVPTLAAGKSLAVGNALTVKVKTSTGTTSTDVTVGP